MDFVQEKKKFSGLRPEPQQGALPPTNVSTKVKSKNFPFCFFVFFCKNPLLTNILPLSILEKHHEILISSSQQHRILA